MKERSHVSKEFIDTMLSRINIVDVIGAYVPFKNNKACCPFHDEKTPSFHIYEKGQNYHCYGCGEHGNAINFLNKYKGLTFIEAMKELSAKAGMQLPTSGKEQQNETNTQELLPLLNQANQFYTQQLIKSSPAIDYLKGRGVSGAAAKKYSVGYAPQGWNTLETSLGAEHKEKLIESGMLTKNEKGNVYDRFRDRIMFPIHNILGNIIGYGGRTISKVTRENPKYLNSPETPLFSKNQELYGLHHVLSQNRKPSRLLIVEGYLDVIGLDQHGINYSVATLGTAANENHLKKLFNYSGELIFCFDGDKAGQKAAWRAAEKAMSVMEDGYKIRFMFLPKGEDPDSYVRKIGKNAFESRVNGAEMLSRYFYNHLSQGIDLNTLEGKTELATSAKPYLQKTKPGLFRNFMMEVLAKRINIDTQTLSTRIDVPIKPSQQANSATSSENDEKLKHSLAQVENQINQLEKMDNNTLKTGEPTHLNMNKDIEREKETRIKQPSMR